MWSVEGIVISISMLRFEMINKYTLIFSSKVGGGQVRRWTSFAVVMGKYVGGGWGMI